MTARAGKSDAISVRAESFVDDSGFAASIEGDERIDFWRTFAEEIFDASKIAETLFADGSDEPDIGFSCDIGMTHGAEDIQDDDQAAGVISDSRSVEPVAFFLHGDIGSFGKDGIEMSGEDENPIGGSAFSDPDDIS